MMTRELSFFSRSHGKMSSAGIQFHRAANPSSTGSHPSLCTRYRIIRPSTVPIAKVIMHQITAVEAENLPAEQATKLVRILELHAAWENHRDDPAKSAITALDLFVRRKAYDAFRAASSEYAAKYGNAHLPEPTQSVPDRLAIWCRVLRVLCRRAEGVCPFQLMKKVYRLTDRSATRKGQERVGRGMLGDMTGVLRELTVVIAWCEAMGSPPYLNRNRVGEAA